MKFDKYPVQLISKAEPANSFATSTHSCTVEAYGPREGIHGVDMNNTSDMRNSVSSARPVEVVPKRTAVAIQEGQGTNFTRRHKSRCVHNAETHAKKFTRRLL